MLTCAQRQVFERSRCSGAWRNEIPGLHHAFMSARLATAGCEKTRCRIPSPCSSFRVYATTAAAAILLYGAITMVTVLRFLDLTLFSLSADAPAARRLPGLQRRVS